MLSLFGMEFNYTGSACNFFTFAKYNDIVFISKSALSLHQLINTIFAASYGSFFCHMLQCFNLLV